MISVSKSIQYKLEYSRWSATAVTTRKIMTPSDLLKAKCGEDDILREMNKRAWQCM